jgi:hypothetical protein
MCKDRGGGVLLILAIKSHCLQPAKHKASDDQTMLRPCSPAMRPQAAGPQSTLHMRRRLHGSKFFKQHFTIVGAARDSSKHKQTHFRLSFCRRMGRVGAETAPAVKLHVSCTLCAQKGRACRTCAVIGAIVHWRGSQRKMDTVQCSGVLTRRRPLAPFVSWFLWEDACQRHAGLQEPAEWKELTLANTACASHCQNHRTQPLWIPLWAAFSLGVYHVRSHMCQGQTLYMSCWEMIINPLHVNMP